MKYTLENLFGSLDPNELDEIMPDNFDGKLPKNILKRIEKTALRKSGIKNTRRRFNIKIFAPVAACLVLTAGLGGFAIAAEAKEYNAAVDFFEKNGLSAEGLDREELKEVYRDISTNRFTNDKTVEVIRRSVQGAEIPQQEPTPEELAAFWNGNITNSANRGKGIEYRTDCEYKLDETLGFDVFDKSIVECYSYESSIWKTEFSSFYVEGCIPMSEGIAVWGFTPAWSSEMTTYCWIARLDDGGNKIWECRLDHGFEDEYIGAVLDNGDGTWAIISRGDLEYLCLSQYDMSGSELSFRKTQVGIKGIWNAARLGDGYLVQLGDYIDGEHAHLAKLDRDGNVTDNFIYESDDCDYYITDMAEFEGNVYLSAYAVPKQIDEGGRYEIADILDYLFNKEDWGISSEELTPMVRDNYTAVLLLCDPAGGEPKNFYSVKGSLGGTLAVENDQLKWNVESIASTFFSPATSSFTIGGDCLVYRYSFDRSGVIAGYEDTGEITRYVR